MKKNINEILERLRSNIPYLEKTFNVKSLQIFGSVARNEQSINSDLDILVEFFDPPGLLKFLELENYLADTLGIKIDLVMKSSIKPRLRKTIFKEAIAL